MKFHLLHRPSAPAGISPYRIADEQSGEISWLNEFLDAQRARGLSLCSVRAYAYDLLHFARWWLPDPPRPFAQIDEPILLDYLRAQRDHQTQPAPQTLYHRLSCFAAYTVSITDAKFHGAMGSDPHVPHAAPSAMAALGERSAASDRNGRTAWSCRCRPMK